MPPLSRARRRVARDPRDKRVVEIVAGIVVTRGHDESLPAATGEARSRILDQDGTDQGTIPSGWCERVFPRRCLLPWLGQQPPEPVFDQCRDRIRGSRHVLQRTTKHRNDAPASGRVVRIADTTTRPVGARTEHVSDHAWTRAQERPDHVQPARRAHDERIAPLLVKKTPDAAGFRSVAQRAHVHDWPVDRRVGIRNRRLELRSDCRRGLN